MSDEEPQLPEGYDDTSRAFVQAFAARGTLTFDEAKPILAAILTAARGDDEAEVNPDSITEDHFNANVAMARAAITPFGLDIRSMMHQVRKERIFAFINSHSDPYTQLATIHSPEEISFVKRILDAMFETFNTQRMEVMAITEAQALKLARPPRDRASGVNGASGEASQSAIDRGLKHSEVLAVLTSLVTAGWWERSRAGYYSLTPRSLLELFPWLIATYNDEDADGDDWLPIKFCESCKEIVIVGERCANRDCNIRLHQNCSGSFWAGRHDQECPKCKTEWDGRHFVGEKAVTNAVRPGR